VRPAHGDVAVRVEFQLTGLVVGQPVDHDERGGAGAGRRDLGVQVGVLLGNSRRAAGRVAGHTRGRAVPRPAEPAFGAVDPVRLTLDEIDGAVGLHVRPARRGDLRVAVEGGKRGQRGVQAVVAPAGHCGPAVVDHLAVRVGRGVGSHLVPAAGVERLLQVPLELRILDRPEVVRSGRARRVQRGYAWRQRAGVALRTGL
jgi:hypothetical protein